MKKMQRIKNIFYRLTRKITERHGVAIIEMALFIPIAMTLLYMIVDISTLLRIKYQIQSLSGTVVQATMAIVNKHTPIKLSDLQDVGETAILAFQGHNKISDYNLYIAWELIQNDGNKNKVTWSGYCSKEGNTNIVNITNGSSSNNVWEIKLQSMPEVAGNVISGEVLASNNQLFYLGPNNGVLITSVVFTQSKKNGWYNVSNLTYNIINKTSNGGFSTQTSTLLDDTHGIFPPVK